MGLWPNVIMTPAHTMGATSAADYEARQRRNIERGRVQFPGLNWRDPWPSPDRVQAWIGGGRWLVWCTTVGCANAPGTHPDWRVARCFECGAVYLDVLFPPDADAITAVLVRRPQVGTRGWQPGETLEQLRAENAAHGVD